MKLTLIPQPDGYDADKAVVLKIGDVDDFIIMSCENALAVANEIKIAVNFFPAMHTVLETLSSQALGGELVEYFKGEMPEDGVAGLRKLVNAVDVILKGVELAKERHDG